MVSGKSDRTNFFRTIILTIAFIVTGWTAYNIGSMRQSTIPKVIKNPTAFLKQPQFINCKQAAKAVNGEGALAVCQRDDRGKSDSIPYVETIIYDSTDEITRDASHRSQIWKDVASSLGNLAPFGALAFKDVKLIGDHYYVVIFDGQYQTEL